MPQGRSCCPAKFCSCESCAKARTRARASVTCPTARWSSSTTARRYRPASRGPGPEPAANRRGRHRVCRMCKPPVATDPSTRRRPRPRLECMDFVTVFTAFNPAEAQLVRSRLEAAGFHPFVTNELSALSMDGYALAAGGILVRCPKMKPPTPRNFLRRKNSAANPARTTRRTRKCSSKLDDCFRRSESAPAGEIPFDAPTLAKYAGDKWFATHLPDAVALPRTTQSVSAILRFANRHRIPVTAARRRPRLRRRLRAGARRHRALARAHEPHQGNQRRRFRRRRPARRHHAKTCRTAVEKRGFFIRPTPPAAPTISSAATSPPTPADRAA